MRLPSFFTISSNTDAGQVQAVTSSVANVTLNRGVYKIAAMNVDLLWKLGSTDVTTSTGSFLGTSDQEVIRVESNSTKFSFIRTAAATADGKINIVPVELFSLPEGDYRV